MSPEGGRIPIRGWRILRADPSGLLLWFDPRVEFPRLFTLPPDKRPDDSEEARRVAVGELELYLDRVGSVSAGEDEDEDPWVSPEEDTELPC